MTSETIDLLKQKFNQTDEVLKAIGLQLCHLEQQNVILRAKVERLEIKHLIGSQHTMRDEL